jgi:hypothetical protein
MHLGGMAFSQKLIDIGLTKVPGRKAKLFLGISSPTDSERARPSSMRSKWPLT